MWLIVGIPNVASISDQSGIHVVVSYHREPPHNNRVVHSAQSSDDEVEVVREVGVRDHDPLGFARRTFPAYQINTNTNARNSNKNEHEGPSLRNKMAKHRSQCKTGLITPPPFSSPPILMPPVNFALFLHPPFIPEVYCKNATSAGSGTGNLPLSSSASVGTARESVTTQFSSGQAVPPLENTPLMSDICDRSSTDPRQGKRRKKARYVHRWREGQTRRGAEVYGHSRRAQPKQGKGGKAQEDQQD